MRRLSVIGSILGCCLRPAPFLAAALGCGLPLASSNASAAAAAPASPAPAAVAGFGHVPLFFEANAGQAEAGVRFLARGRDHAVQLTDHGVVLTLRGTEGPEGSNEPGPRGHRASAGSGRNVPAEVIELRFPGANASPVLEGLEAAGGQVSYLVGSTSQDWLRGLPTWRRVRAGDLYPGIDLLYYGNDQTLEFDFMVAAGADPSVIALQFQGATRLEIDRAGDLVVHTRGAHSGQLRQHRPVAYQRIDGARREVAARYVLRGRHTAALALGSYDRTRPLVVDPLLAYSSYLGGSRGDIGWSIAVDAAGAAYIAGDTLSIFKKLPLSGFQTNFGGGTQFGGDAFVAKIDPTGTNLVYLTYLGGSGLDGAVGIAVDGTGSAYVTGYTDSTNFPTAGVAGVLQAQIAGTNNLVFKSFAPDAFVAKLDPSGSNLVYSTYLGGEQNDTGIDISVDGTGAAYVVGFTESALTYRTTNQVCSAVYTNGVLRGTTCVTNLSIVRLLVASEVVTNSVTPSQRSRRSGVTNEIRVVTTTLLTSTQATSGLAIKNAVQTNNAGLQDFFIAKLTPDGSQLDYLTYLGGSRDDFGTGIGVDGSGNAVVSGYSESVDFPVVNPLQAALGGIRDGVVAKLGPAGSALVYSTYLGGRGNDSAYRLAVDAAGSAYVTGASSSGDFPSTPGGINRGGVFVSTDGGASWGLSSSGLAHTVISTLAVDPATAGLLYAGTPRGVFRSTDGGANWTPRNVGLSNLAILSLALHPTNSDVIYAGTSGGLYRSDDASATWTNSSAGMGGALVRTFLFDSAVPSTVYAGTGSGIYRSLQAGLSNWVAFNRGVQTRSINVLRQDPANPSLLYAATDLGIYASTNSATNWQSRSTGLSSRRAVALLIDPAAPQTLYAGTARGFNRSTNGGTNWTVLTNGLGRPLVTSLRLDPTVSTTLLAGTTNGVFASLDSGASWAPSQTSLSSRDVSTFASDGSPAGPLFVATRGNNFAGGTNDAFLVKLVPDGSAFAYACTFGGTRNDEGRDVAVDGDGIAYVTGLTASRNFPVTGASSQSQTNLAGRSDVFVTSFDPTGSSNLFSIYLGGRGHDFGNAIAVDTSGGVYVVGQTESGHFVVTNALQPVFGAGRRDAFVLKLVPEAATPLQAAPALRVTQTAGQIVVRWPVTNLSPNSEYVLEQCTGSLGPWVPTVAPVARQNGFHTVTLPAAAKSCFFRLRRP